MHQPGDPLAQARLIGHDIVVGLGGGGFARADDGVEGVLPKGRAHDIEQLDGERRVRIGKALLCGLGELPVLGGAADAPGKACSMDKAVIGEPRQLLASRFACCAQHLANSRSRERTMHLEQHKNALGGGAWRPARVFQVGA